MKRFNSTHVTAPTCTALSRIGFIFPLLAGFLVFSGLHAQQKPIAYKDSTVVHFFQRTQGWSAGDGAFSIPLSDGSVLWTMGDSFIDTYDSVTQKVPCLFNTNNALLLQPRGDWNWRNTKTLDSRNPVTKTFFRDSTDNGDWYWPVSGIQLADTIYVYYSGIARAAGGLGFAPTDKDVLAKIKVPEMELVGYHALPDLNAINFGVGFIEDKKSGYVYAYGHKFRPDARQNDIYVARFRARRPTGSWEFWDGRRWNKDVAKAVSVRKDAGFTPMVCKVKDKYVIISSELSIGCDQGKDIYATVSDRITGPFSERRTIFTIDDTVQGHYPFFYVPVGHPEFINEQQELLVTYNVNGYGECVTGCVNNRMDPNHYRPRGARIPLKLIDPRL